MTLRSNITLNKRVLPSGNPIYMRPLMIHNEAEIGCIHDATAFRYLADGGVSGGRIWAGDLPDPSTESKETRHLEVVDSRKVSFGSLPCFSVTKGGRVWDGVVDSETSVSVFFLPLKVYRIVLDCFFDYRKKHQYLQKFFGAIDGFAPPLTFPGEGFGNGGGDFGSECLSYLMEEMEEREERNARLGVHAGGYSAFEYFLDVFFGGKKKTAARETLLEKLRIIIENPIPILRIEKSGQRASTAYNVSAVISPEDYVGAWAEDLTDMYKAIPFVGEGIPREALEECFIESYPREL